MLHHVSLLARDIPATIAFWRERLGMTLVMNTVNQENHHMRHVFFGDAHGTPGSVVTFFGVDRLGPRYDNGSRMQQVRLGIPQNAADYWQDRLGSLTVQDPDGVSISLLPLAPASEDPAIRGWWGSDLVVVDPAATAEFFASMLPDLAVAARENGARVQNGDGRFLDILPAGIGVHRMGRGSIDHIALAVADRGELAAIRRRAQRHGYLIEEYADRGWFQSLYVREPNGNRIEFATVTPGFPPPVQGLGLPAYLTAQRASIAQYWANQGVRFDD